MLPSDGVRLLLKQGGQIARIRYYTETIGSVWDDERTIVQSGNDLYVSGLFQNLNTTKSSVEATLLEEGRLIYGDAKVYVAGSIDTTSGARVFTIAKSGNSTNEVVYKDVLPGIQSTQYFGETPYKLIYIRQLVNGSLT